MKFTYIDESGHDDKSGDAVFTIAAIQIDSTKLKSHQRKMELILNGITNKYSNTDKQIEIKTSQLYKRKSYWKNIDTNSFIYIVNSIVDALFESAKLYIFATNIDKYKNNIKHFNSMGRNNNYWGVGMVSIISQIQCVNYKTAKNKGNTVVIVDDNKTKHDNMSDFIHKPSDIFDEISFKSKDLKDKRFIKNISKYRYDQIIDTPFCIKSDHSHHVQCADILSYLLRRIAEFDPSEPEFEGEEEFLKKLIKTFKTKQLKPQGINRKSGVLNVLKKIEPDNWPFSI